MRDWDLANWIVVLTLAPLLIGLWTGTLFCLVMFVMWLFQ